MIRTARRLPASIFYALSDRAIIINRGLSETSMGMSLAQFVENLTATGLMSASEVAAICDHPQPDERPADAKALARLLVQRKKLTSYQASAILRGEHRSLVFHEYVILDRIGAGGMGVVLKARHRRMDRTVAIKVLPTAVMKSQEAVERFYREVRAVARLSHPNIVAAHDASEHDGMHYLVMEYVDGRDLAAVVHEQGALSVAQAVDCILQAAKGLEYSHAMGIVHRDIKPSNLLLTPNGLVKILDLGLALLGEGGTSQAPSAGQLTQTGQIMGTLDYMSPEQAVNTHQADERSDVYSLGATLYCLLTARALYAGDTVVAVLVAHREAPIPSLCVARGDVPQALDAVFQRMVAKRPADRQQSMGQVIAELNACLAGDAAQVAVEPSSGGALSELVRTASGEVATVKPQLATSADQDTLKLTHQDQDTGKQLPAVGPEPSGEPAEPTRRRSRFGLIASSGAIAVFIVLAVVFGRQFLPGVAKNGDGAGNSGTGSSGAEQRIPLAVGGEAGQEWKGNGLGMRFCWCPPGYFKMGDPPNQVDVKLTHGFWLGKYEVTQAEYQHLKKGHHSHFSPAGGGKALVAELNTDRFPAESVSWVQAADFCAALTEEERQAGRLPQGWEYRLPTEAQWEYACRAGTGTQYWFGDAGKDLTDYDWYKANAENRTHEVGQKKPNPWGFHDMHGNVGEWCRDWHHPTLPGGVDPEATGEAANRVFRGGCWGDEAPKCRSAYRGTASPARHIYFYGFRVALVQTDADAEGAKQPAPKTEPKVPALSAGAAVGQEWSSNSLSMKFCWCPPGEFKMGQRPDAVDVKLTRGFWLGKYEVTQAEYRRVTKSNPSSFSPKGKGKAAVAKLDTDRLPVDWVTWTEATAFCRSLTDEDRRGGHLPADWEYTLPTEAQWEYACRAGSQAAYSYGNDESQLTDFAWYDANSAKRTHGVGQKQPNAWGLHDMHGNLWEWCRDRFQEKPPGGVDPEGATGAQRVLRGACWNSTASRCRATARHGNDPDYQSYGYGFRMAIVRTTGARAGAEPVSLFDGRSLNGWRGLDSEPPPSGWRVEDGAIAGPGDKTYLATVDSYADYELELEWKLGRGANAGIFYRWSGELRSGSALAGLGDPLAPEYQIVDNANHFNGKKPETATGSVFSLIAPTKDVTKPAGQWNATRLIVRGNHVEHWLNGEKIVEYDYGSDDWKRRVAAHPGLSKEKTEYGRAARGRIALQSYSGQVWYREIRIKAIDGVAGTDR